jgi:hypothetical protein
MGLCLPPSLSEETLQGFKYFRRHCQVVGDDIVTRQQQALSGRDFYRPDA